MTNEEFQKIVLEKLTHLEQGQVQLSEDIQKIATEGQKDIKAVLEIINKRTERIETKLDILEHRQFEQETDIRLIKKAQ